MRLMALPDVRDELAADAGAARLVAGHDAAARSRRSPCPCRPGPSGSCRRSTYSRRPGFETRLRPWMTGLRSSVYLSRTRSTRPTRAGSTVEVLDVALLLQDARELRLEASRRASRRRRGRRAGRCGCGSGSRLPGRSSTCALPARLRHAGDHALVRDLAQADPAEAELAEVRARATAPLAAVVVACLVLATRAAGGPSVKSLPSTPVLSSAGVGLALFALLALFGRVGFSYASGFSSFSCSSAACLGLGLQPRLLLARLLLGLARPRRPRARRALAARTACRALAAARRPPRRSWRVVVIVTSRPRTWSIAS